MLVQVPQIQRDVEMFVEEARSLGSRRGQGAHVTVHHVLQFGLVEVQAHGPKKERDFSRKINKNTKAKALACVLSQKLRDGEMLFVDSFGLTEAKAKEARSILGALSQVKGIERLKSKRVNAALILLPGRDTATELSFRNFGNVEVMQTKDVNPVELLNYKYVVVAKPEENVKALALRVATKTARKTTSAGKATK